MRPHAHSKSSSSAGSSSSANRGRNSSSSSSATTTTNTNTNTTPEPVSHNLFDYLSSLPPTSLKRIYGDETRGSFACKAVLQRLPELARQYVIRLTVCGGEFPRSEVEMWSAPNCADDAAESLRRMEELYVIEPLSKRKNDDDDTDSQSTSASPSNDIIRLTPTFFSGMKKVLTSLESSPYPAVTPSQLSELRTLSTDKKNSSKKYLPPPTPEELETYTQKRWDSVLHFLVGSDGSDDPPKAVITFLEKTGLMQDDPDWTRSHRDQEAPLVITSKGYEFMLMDVHVQVWQFILKYFYSLANHPKCDYIREEALLFLICLSYCRVGAPYPAGCLTKDSRILMKDFSHFGLLYVCKMGSSSGGQTSLFYPTRVAVNLIAGGVDATVVSGGGKKGGEGPSSSTSTNSVLAASVGAVTSASATRALEAALESPIPSRSHIAIIVQTNFQLCAYTTSQLHVSMLGLFCEVSTYRRLSNVIFFKITRDSVKGAFRLGIEAQQILLFLKMHAHPRLRSGDGPLIPENVEDQIILWDRERRRVVLQEVWCHQCGSKNEYAAVQRYAMDNDVYAWSSEHKLKIMVNYEKAEMVMAFVRRWRTRTHQRERMADEEGLGPLRRAGRNSSYA